ncbi:hypothetical protein C725_2006 [Pacificimonas flava]|uniref:Uncharacterized protein n=1 Tax=Pacificimonas flava TaxID=1234595 RepID=M2T7W5_9SPHN|nr:hypothetical protein C725_2006 [Pacificimonas flava]
MLGFGAAARLDHLVNVAGSALKHSPQHHIFVLQIANLVAQPFFFGF